MKSMASCAVIERWSHRRLPFRCCTDGEFAMPRTSQSAGRPSALTSPESLPALLSRLPLLPLSPVTLCRQTLALPAQAYDEPLPLETREHSQRGRHDVRIKTVSARNDMISGGDVLVWIDVSSHTQLNAVRIELNNNDITSVFKPIAGSHSLLGLVKGLRLGDNQLTVRAKTWHLGDDSARLRLTNWPSRGPIFSGPHQRPYFCMTHLFNLPITGGNLGPALDENCSTETRVNYIYRNTANQFRPLPDPGVRPADLAQTTTNDGRTVPYIVRWRPGRLTARSTERLSCMIRSATSRPIHGRALPAGMEDWCTSSVAAARAGGTSRSRPGRSRSRDPAARFRHGVGNAQRVRQQLR